MHVTSERRVDELVERRFTLDDVRGILWLPASASPSDPAPVVLAGLPQGLVGLEPMYPRLLPRARSAASTGCATVAIELAEPGRARPPGVDEARAAMQDALAAGRPVPEDVVDRLVLPVVEQAVPAWQSVLDAVLDLPEIGDRAGFSGGVASVGVRLARVEPRLRAAILFAGSLVPRSILHEAREVTVPVHVLLQWNDEGNDRQRSLELYDALGSAEKTLTANLGGHTGVPRHAGEAAASFLTRHLRPPDR